MPRSVNFTAIFRLIYALALDLCVSLSLSLSLLQYRKGHSKAIERTTFGTGVGLHETK